MYSIFNKSTFDKRLPAANMELCKINYVKCDKLAILFFSAIIELVGELFLATCRQICAGYMKNLPCYHAHKEGNVNADNGDAKLQLK